MQRLNYEVRERLIEEAKKYNFDELELFQAELGWQDWMNGFTDAEEGEEITEAEGNLIDDITRQAFLFAHEEN